ncbi:MAG: aminotransferase class V-fold PLP-dependent enzyme, partial [Hyphomicrobiaceae bacterium]
APDWAALRNAFPLLNNFAYLDLGRKAPLPIYAKEAADAWFRDTFDTGGEAAFSMSSTEETRAAVANTFGAPLEQIALIKNTSEGINIIGAGFPWVAGDNVVITEHEHENNTFPWRHLANRGVEIRFAEADDDGCVRLAGYERAVNDRTRILAVAWVAYGNGYRADITALSTFCKSRGIKLVVDAIQAVGILSDRVDSLGADVVVAGGHKAQFSLTGAGFMYLTPEMIDLIRPPYAAKFSFTSTDRHQAAPKLQSNARRFEYGNPNFMGLAVQRRSAEFVAGIELKNIEARVRELTTYLIDQAQARQIKILTPSRWEERAGIVAIAVDGDADEIEASLKAQGVRIAAKDGHLRAGINFYNNHDDIDRLVAGLVAA